MEPELDTDRPPPCPSCGAQAIRELTLTSARSTARYSHCDACRLTFLIDLVSLDNAIADADCAP